MQTPRKLALWAEMGVNRQVTAGWSIPMSWFQALDPLMVFIATPVLVARWAHLAKRGVDTPSLRKMAFGAALVGLSYVLLAAVAAWSEARGVRADWPWLAGWFVLMTVGELYILPVGLGLFGRLAPEGSVPRASRYGSSPAFSATFLPVGSAPYGACSRTAASSC